jgi:hypothetical protein
MSTTIIAKEKAHSITLDLVSKNPKLHSTSSKAMRTVKCARQSHIGYFKIFLQINK